MSLENITLISFGQLDKDMLDMTASAVAQEYHRPVILKDGHLDLSEYFDPGRRQYNGNQLLHHIEGINLSGSLKILGLFNVDLFIPILTYIFGQAYLGGKSGIASIYRLDNKRYGMASDRQLMLTRFQKEVIHELGHTFGLVHCPNPECVMRSSTYVEDIDQKGLHLCRNCKDQIEKH